MSAHARRVPFIALLLSACAVLCAAAPVAQAFRSPNSKEQKGVMRAFDKKHGKKAKKLFVQQIRVSTVNSRYAAVLYDQRVTGYKGGIGNTTIEYYKRVAGHAADPPGAGAAGMFDDFTSLGQNAPASVRDDADPVYRVTFSTTADETITRETTWGCYQAAHGSGKATNSSQGQYSWSVAFQNVPLSRSDFSVKNGKGFFHGSYTIENPCNVRIDECAPHQKRNVNYSIGGLSIAERQYGPYVGGIFHSGYLAVLADARGSTIGCLQHGPAPIPGVQVGLPLHWPGNAIDNQTWNVDDGDFYKGELGGRLGDCATIDAASSCSESVDGFAGLVRAERVHRG